MKKTNPPLEILASVTHHTQQFCQQDQHWLQRHVNEPIKQIELLDNSWTNRCYKLVGQHSSYYFRIDRPNSCQLGIDRAREQWILSAIANAEYAPKVIAQDIERGYLLCQWQPGHIASLSSELLQHLASATADLHGRSQPFAPQLPSNITLNLQQHGQALLQNIQVAQQFTQPFLTLLQCADTAIPTPNKTETPSKPASFSDPLPPIPAMGLCHLDLNPCNVIWTDQQKILLIDWEYGAVTNPRLDIAFLFLSYKLDQTQQRHYFHSYLHAQVRQHLKHDLQNQESSLLSDGGRQTGNNSKTTATHLAAVEIKEYLKGYLKEEKQQWIENSLVELQPFLLLARCFTYLWTKQQQAHGEIESAQIWQQDPNVLMQDLEQWAQQRSKWNPP